MQDRPLVSAVMRISNETAGRACFMEETASSDGE